jgi:hypothetical protein
MCYNDLMTNDAERLHQLVDEMSRLQAEGERLAVRVIADCVKAVEPLATGFVLETETDDGMTWYWFAGIKVAGGVVESDDANLDELREDDDVLAACSVFNPEEYSTMEVDFADLAEWDAAAARQSDVV